MKTMYSKTHEWVEIDGSVGKVGISDFAQRELGDLVFISLPDVGKTLVAGKVLCDVESVKAVSEINSPVSGVVVAINDELDSAPELINKDARAAWICQVQIQSLGELMTEEQYNEFVKTSSH